MYQNITTKLSDFTAIGPLHKAVQFISIVGKNLLEDKEDDSNTNMIWNNEFHSFAGNWIEGDKTFRVELDINRFQLVLTGLNFNQIAAIELDGKKKDEIFNWLKSSISSLGHDSDKLKHIDHYQISEHEIDKGIPFKKPDQNSLKLISIYYSNADYLLRKITQEFQFSIPVNIWPHHFDIGAYISLDHDRISALGIGMAIPDTIANDFYYYQYGLGKGNNIDYSKLEALPFGKWYHNGWSGGALSFEEITESDHQEEAIISFFASGKEQFLRSE